MIIEIVEAEETMRDGYLIGVDEEIRRVLTTRKGSIPMNPHYGSDLWRYRDRTPDGETRLEIIAEAYEAIERNVTRVRPRRVTIDGESSGRFALRVEIERRPDASA